MKKAIVCLVLAAMMLFTAMPAFADGDRSSQNFTFRGSCKKYFETDLSVDKTNYEDWLSFSIYVTKCRYLNSASYDDHYYICMIDTSGHARSEDCECYLGENEPFAPLSGARNYNELNGKVMHHIYYNQNHASSTNKLTAWGTVTASKMPYR